MPVLTLAHGRIYPGTGDAFVKRFNAYRTQVMENEPGTLNFDLYMGSEDAETFVVVECFADDAARASHNDTPYHDDAVTDLRKMIAEADADLYLPQQ